MKDYNEMAQSVFERINQYNIQQKRRKKTIKNTIILAVVVAVIGTAAGGAHYIYSRDSGHIESTQSTLTDRNHAAGSSNSESRMKAKSICHRPLKKAALQKVKMQSCPQLKRQQAKRRITAEVRERAADFLFRLCRKTERSKLPVKK